MPSIVEQLLQYGFLTGSQAFGTARPDSDIDIVYPIYYSQHIEEIIKGLEQARSEYFAGYYVAENGKQINLIPVHPHEFLPWYLATQAMQATLKESGITDPIKKYAIFQGIVCLFKGMVDQKQNITAYENLAKQIINGYKPMEDFLIEPDF